MHLQSKRRPETIRAGVLVLSVVLTLATAVGQWTETITLADAGLSVSILALIAAATISMVVPDRRRFDRAVVALYLLYSASALFLVAPSHVELFPTIESQTVGATGLGLLVPLTYYLYSRAIGEWFDDLRDARENDDR